MAQRVSQSHWEGAASWLCTSSSHWVGVHAERDRSDNQRDNKKAAALTEQVFLVVVPAVAHGVVVEHARHLDGVAGTHHAREHARLLAHAAAPVVVVAHRLHSIVRELVQRGHCRHLIVDNREVVARQTGGTGKALHTCTTLSDAKHMAGTLTVL